MKVNHFQKLAIIFSVSSVVPIPILIAESSRNDVLTLWLTYVLTTALLMLLTPLIKQSRFLRRQLWWPDGERRRILYNLLLGFVLLALVPTFNSYFIDGVALALFIYIGGQLLAICVSVIFTVCARKS